MSSGVTQNEVLPQKVHDIQKRPPDVIPIVPPNTGNPEAEKIAEINIVPESKK